VNIAFGYSMRFDAEFMALTIGCFVTLFATLLSERHTRKVMVFAVPAAGFVITALYYVFLRGANLEGAREVVRAMALGGVFLLLSVCMPAIRKQTSFNLSFLGFFKAFFSTVFYVGIAFGGILLVLGAIDNLLFRLHPDTYSYVNSTTLILVAPIVLLSMLPSFGREDEAERDTKIYTVPAFLRILLMYVLLPLVAIYTLVLLLYLVKTLTMGDPEGILYPMILTYCVAVIGLYVLTDEQDKKIFVIYRLVFPKLAGLIALYQTIRILMKIPAFGITHDTYYAILYGLFAILAGVITSVLPPKKNQVIGLILAGLLLISAVPPVDAFMISTFSQTAKIEEVLARNSMRDGERIVEKPDISLEDREILRNGMTYLDEAGDTGKIPGLPEDFGFWEDFETVFGFPTYEESTGVNTNYDEYSYSMDRTAGLPVSGDILFSTVYGKDISMGGRTTVGTFVEEGQQYQLDVVSDTKEISVELLAADGQVLATASVTEFAEELRADRGDIGYNLSPEAMLLTASGDGANLSVAFYSIYGYEQDGQSNLTAEMLIFADVGTLER